MDDSACMIELCVAADEQSYAVEAVINRVAEQSCRADDGAGDDAFVMVRTERRGDTLVKTVVFDRRDAAQRFRTLIEIAEPTLRAAG